MKSLLLLFALISVARPGIAHADGDRSPPQKFKVEKLSGSSIGDQGGSADITEEMTGDKVSKLTITQYDKNQAIEYMWVFDLAKELDGNSDLYSMWGKGFDGNGTALSWYGLRVRKILVNGKASYVISAQRNASYPLGYFLFHN